MTRPRVVVVGAGFGGLRVAQALRGAPVDTLLVDQANHHLFQPLLYEVATCALDLSDIAYPVRGLVRRIPNASFRLGTATGIDWDHRELILEGGGQLPFDFLVLAAGATTATFGVPGVDEHAYPLKTLEDALRLRDHLLVQFEAADADPSHIDDGALTIVVVGGGPTGVEVAGAISELSRIVLARDFPSLDLDRVRILLVELTESVLPSFHPHLRAYAAEALLRRHVELRLSTGVSNVGAESVSLTSGGNSGDRRWRSRPSSPVSMLAAWMMASHNAGVPLALQGIFTLETTRGGSKSVRVTRPRVVSSAQGSARYAWPPCFRRSIRTCGGNAAEGLLRPHVELRLSTGVCPPDRADLSRCHGSGPARMTRCWNGLWATRPRCT